MPTHRRPDPIDEERYLSAAIAAQLRRSMLGACLSFCLFVIGATLTITLISQRESLGSIGMITLFFSAMGGMACLFAVPALLILNASKIMVWFRLGTAGRAKTGAACFAAAAALLSVIYAWLLISLVQAGQLNITLISAMTTAIVFCGAYSYILFRTSVSQEQAQPTSH